jgi:hypothetical protein
MRVWVNIPVQVIGYEGDLGDNVDLVVQELDKLDHSSEALLDYSADSDGTNDTAEFAVTVSAANLGEALNLAMSCVRAAIHAAGAATHGWDDDQAADDVVIYQVDADEAVAVRALVNA